MVETADKRDVEQQEEKQSTLAEKDECHRAQTKMVTSHLDKNVIKVSICEGKLTADTPLRQRTPMQRMGFQKPSRTRRTPSKMLTSLR